MKAPELYYNFFKVFDVADIKELKIDTHLLHSALVQRHLFLCMQPTMKKQYESLQSDDFKKNILLFQ